MAAQNDRIVLRSYRLAFELERRIHRIDRFRVPLPYGVPLGALGWAAATVVALVVLRQVPLVGAALGLLPLPVQLVFIPGAAAHALCRTTKDGRLVHEAVLARVLRRVRAQRLLALEPVPSSPALNELSWTVVADERSARPVPAVVAGPAEVLVCSRTRAELDGAEVRLHGLGEQRLDTPRALVLRDGERLVIAP